MPRTRRGLLRAFLPCVGASTEQPPTTLVSVFLRGGADGLGLVAPYGDPDYRRLRPSLALSPPGEEGGCLDLDGTFGLHPAGAPLLDAYRAGRLAVVHAVGSDDRTRSHFEAQDQMEHGAACAQLVAGGWLGRALRLAAEGGGLSAVAIGTHTPEALRGAPMAASLSSLEELQLRGAADDARRDQLMQALGQLYGEEGLLGGAGRDTLLLMRRVEALPAGDGAAARGYPPGDFGRGLQDVARLITARVGLRAACLDLDGWDTHFFQGTTGGLLAGRVSELSQGLAAFEADLGDCRRHVVVVVMTEFGRRAYENASLGTDHGRAGAMLVLGEGLRGGRVHGDWPGLGEEALESPGDLRVTTDYRDVLREVLTRAWGEPDPAVFPGHTPRRVGLLA